MVRDGEHPLTHLGMALQAAGALTLKPPPLPTFPLPATAGRKNNHQKAKIWAKEAAGAIPS